MSNVTTTTTPTTTTTTPSHNGAEGGDRRASSESDVTALRLHIFNTPLPEPLTYYEELKHNPVLRQAVIRQMENTPKLFNVAPEEKERLFIIKLRQCSLVFDFADATSDLKGKELKLLVLKDCIDYVVSRKVAPFGERVYPEVFNMFAFNVLRSLPPPVNPSGPAYDPEEDEPVLRPEWVHLQLVYEFLVRFFDSTDFNAGLAKKYLSVGFVGALLLLFDNEDPRERDILKTTLHRIYGKFLHLRAFIRKAIANIFLEFIYERERHVGIAELLEILGSIINGFAVPLKDEHVLFLEKVLIPLHRPRAMTLYYPQLAYCVNQFCLKDKGLRDRILLKLFKIWPVLSSAKQVLFLSEVEEIVDGMDLSAFEGIVLPLLNQLVFCINSQQFQVAERALYFWNNANFVSLLMPFMNSDAYALIFPALYRFCSSHWNTSIHGLAINALKVMIDANPDGFRVFVRDYRNEYLLLMRQVQGDLMPDEDERTYLWKGLLQLGDAKRFSGLESTQGQAVGQGSAAQDEAVSQSKMRKSLRQRRSRMSLSSLSKDEVNALLVDAHGVHVPSKETGSIPGHNGPPEASARARRHSDPDPRSGRFSVDLMQDYKNTLKLKRKSNLPMNPDLFQELSKHLSEDSLGPSDLTAFSSASLASIKQVSEEEAFRLGTSSEQKGPEEAGIAVTDAAVEQPPSGELVGSPTAKKKGVPKTATEKESSMDFIKKSFRAKLLPRPSKNKGK